MKIQNLSLWYRLPKQKKKYIFSRLTYQFPDLGMVAITGDSGVGKSSLLKVIANLIKPQIGKITLPKNNKLYPPVYLSDQLQLIPHWKVCDYLQGDLQQTQLQSLGFTDEEVNKPYHQLSVGQQVRLKIILFLHQNACVYLLDEPTHALDDKNRKKLIEFLSLEAQEKLILIATHDPLLIQCANVEFKMISPFKTIYFENQQLISLSKKKISSKISDKYSSKKWFNLLRKLNRPSFIGGTISFGTWILQITLFLLSIFTFQIQIQMNDYRQSIQNDPWLKVTEIQTIPINDSPFQLVKTSIPRQESFNGWFEDAISPRWLIDISDWFPKKLEINHVDVTIRFVDLPFNDDYLTTAWIYPKKSLPSSLSLSTLAIPNLPNPLTYSGPIIQLFNQIPKTWFEPPQLLLSYWQWLAILSHQTTWMDNSLITYLDVYLTTLPPTNALMFIPNANQRTFIQNLTNHPWRFTIPTEEVYPLIAPLGKPLSSFLPIIIFTLFLIWVVLSWSKLHWIYQQYHHHWRWLIALHHSFETIWSHVTHKSHIESMLFHGISLAILTILLSIQTIISTPSIWVIFILQSILWILLETSRLLIKKIFHYA